jgi:pyruvate,water dikinase
MNWYHKIFRRSRNEKDDLRTLTLRCTRFRQLVRNYGKILDAVADAAEKQGGDYILDRQYIVSLSEVVIDLTEAIVFDLNVLADERYDDFYDLLDRYRLRIQDIITMEDGERAGGSTDAAVEPATDRAATSTADLSKLAKAIAESQVLFQHVGQIACRGIAAGPVFNMETETDPDAFPQGAVMVASDIAPDEQLIRRMRLASAILTDFGEPARDTATLAREFNIPSIVGLKDASRRLETGTEVTVDADENIVYLGRVGELLEYDETERLGHEEEAEYRILRRLRRFMFPLTLDAEAGPGAGLDDCRTLHDLVHLAHELAAEAQFELVVSLGNLERVVREFTAGLDVPLYVIDVGGGLNETNPDLGGPDFGEICSLPLRVFAVGMDETFRKFSRTFGPSKSAPAVTAMTTEEHANIVVQRPGGFDIVDSMIGESKDSNHIYCRFAASASGNENETARGAVSCEVLSRLNFAAARTTRATAAWLSGIPRTEMEECLTIVGRLGAYLLEADASGWDNISSESSADSFMAQHV